MRARFIGEDGKLGLKNGCVYNLAVSSKYNDNKIRVQFKAENSDGKWNDSDDWNEFSYAGLNAFCKDWSDIFS